MGRSFIRTAPISTTNGFINAHRARRMSAAIREPNARSDDWQTPNFDAPRARPMPHLTRFGNVALRIAAMLTPSWPNSWASR
jgi:hypothetical protein